MKRALVTGAGGFIGSSLAGALLDRGVETVCFARYTSTGSRGLLDGLPAGSRSGMNVVLGDIRDPESIRRAMSGCDTVFHLAALIGIPYSYVSPADVFSVNVQGTLNVLQACRETGPGRVIVTSTSEVYGTAVSVPMTEEHPLSARSPYAASKIAADQMALSFFRSYSLPVAVCRPFNTFGPGQSLRAVIPSIIFQALSKPEVEIGSVSPTRDFLFVDDTVAGFLAMAEAPAVVGEVIQFGTGIETSIEEVARRILALCGGGSALVSREERVRPSGSEVERLVASGAKARKLLGWAPAVSLEDGLARTIDWIRSSLPHLADRGYAI
jgi:NAD dependent epimerase/dehydratase